MSKKILSLEEWLEIGKEKFKTSDVKQFKFECPNCKQTQTGQEFIDAKINYNRFGFEKDGIYHHDQLIVAMDVRKLKQINCGKDTDLWTDDICPDCTEKLVRKDFYIKSVSSRPVVLTKEGFEYFKKHDDNLTLEKFKRCRISLIHERINYKGMIEKHNHLKI